MRDTELIQMRPTIPLSIEDSTPIETFQNMTLRPILKLQHELLVAVFKHYIIFRKNAFNQVPKKDKPAYIENSIKTDLKFKNRLVGIIIGHFTLEEYAFFQEHETEIVRRTTDLIIQRLQSAF
jgi:hypothetical protein